MSILAQRRDALRASLQLLLALSASLALGCGRTALPVAAARHGDAWNVIAQRSWTIAADAESYKCTVERLPSDKYITGFRVVAPAPAQARVTLSVVESAATPGDFDCIRGAVGGSEMIYASGTGTDAIVFPVGEGVHVSKGQYLLLVVHLRNAADSVVSSSTKIEARDATEKEVTTPIHVLLAGSAAAHS
jgi:hypothetical protein